MKCFKPYDVFISHAAEDKVDLADEIKQSLAQSGLRVWYSSDQLPLGENIRSHIGKGLRQCRYGVVILSQSSLKSPWIIHELYALMERREKNKTIIIPVRHYVTSEQVKQFAPDIANIYSLSTNDGLDKVISKLQAEIKSRSLICSIISYGVWMADKKWRSVLQVFAGLCVIAISMLIYLQRNSTIPSDDFIEQKIHERIQAVNGNITQCSASNTLAADSILALREPFDQQSSHSNRHAFEFATGIAPPIHAKVSLKEAGIPVNLATVSNAYGFHYFTACISDYLTEKENFYFTYSFINNDSVVFDITNAQHINEYQYQVTVSYTNFIRAVYIACSYDAESSSRLEKIKYTGLSHKEEFIFEKRDEEWQLTGYY